MNRFTIVIVAASSLIVYSSFQQGKIYYVPDEKTAINIALAVWQPIYGDTLIDKYKPYQARLGKDSVWIVWGTLPEGFSGGTPQMSIQKKDGKILQVILGK